MLSVSKLDLSAMCEHNYCPHHHYKKCRKQRERNIPYTYRPNKKIDTTCNVHSKVFGNLTTRNVPTLAFEKYIARPVLADEQDNNFSRNYYLENCPETYQLNNTLLAETQQELAMGNAYALANGATEEYNQFAKKRQEYLDNARRRANVAFNQYYTNKKVAKEDKKAEQARWVTQYYRKVQELIDHIFKKKKKVDLDDSSVKEKMFIRQQSQNTSKHLATVKVKDPNIALNILESLRAVLLKKKMDMEQDRKDQEHNISATASYMDSSSTSQNISSASFMSATTDVTQVEKEGTFAEKFCDFETLQKKWGKSNVDEVRNILRTMLCKNLITKAEGQQMKERKKAREKDNFLRKEMEKMGKLKKKNQQGKQNIDLKKQQASNSMIGFSKEEKLVAFFKDHLTKQEQAVKSSLLRGGIFDSLGTRYQRNRNYGSLFSKRKEQSLLDINFKDESRQTNLTTDRVIR